MTAPTVDFAHLAALTDGYGTFEHACYAEARREDGYCTDDVARLLVVAAREPDPAPAVRDLARGAFGFLAAAQGPTGDTRNRRSADGRWHGRRNVDDCWGRSLWAFGVVAEHRTDWMGQEALTYFERGTERRSPWPRSMAYAALGAGAVLRAHPRNTRAKALLADVGDLMRHPSSLAWPWPEARLTYANALLPHAMLETGAALGRAELSAAGLRLLGWLLDRETAGGHLSVTPAGGAGPGDDGGFDQQPIEVATLAEACARAWTLTGDQRWAEGVRAASSWFDGANDSGATMWDPATGGSYDGLEASGVNRNQGAESTIALLATRQHARAVAAVPP